MRDRFKLTRIPARAIQSVLEQALIHDHCGYDGDETAREAVAIWLVKENLYQKCKPDFCYECQTIELIAERARK